MQKCVIIFKISFFSRLKQHFYKWFYRHTAEKFSVCVKYVRLSSEPEE